MLMTACTNSPGSYRFVLFCFVFFFFFFGGGGGLHQPSRIISTLTLYFFARSRPCFCAFLCFVLVWFGFGFFVHFYAWLILSFVEISFQIQTRQACQHASNKFTTASGAGCMKTYQKIVDN